MGRSSQEQAQQNRTRIVETATSLFLEYGVDNVSVADVMHATGMTTGGFYKHFASKDALVTETFTLAFGKAAATWQKTLKRQQNDPDAIVRHYFQKRPPNQTCPILAFAPHTATGISGPPSTQAYKDGVKELFQQFLDHQKSSDANTGQDARVLFAAMIGARFLALATHDADWAQSIQEAVQTASA